jgi:hypothetical protein
MSAESHRSNSRHSWSGLSWTRALQLRASGGFCRAPSRLELGSELEHVLAQITADELSAKRAALPVADAPGYTEAASERPSAQSGAELYAMLHVVAQLNCGCKTLRLSCATTCMRAAESTSASGTLRDLSYLVRRLLVLHAQAEKHGLEMFLQAE